MKKNKIILIVSLLLIFIYSCKKDTYLPKITITSIETNNEISSINLNIIGVENEIIEYTGICYDTLKNPDILTNQVLIEGESKKIQVSNLKANTVLYFKAFISNKYGYTKSVDFKYTVPFNNTTVPCTINNNTVIKNGITYNITSNTSNINNNNEFEKTIICSTNLKLKFVFKEMPVSGIYTTVQDFSYNLNKMVKVYVAHSSLTGWTYMFPTNNYESVYINNNNTDSFTISFCELTYNYENIDYLLKGNFTKN